MWKVAVRIALGMGLVAGLSSAAAAEETLAVYVDARKGVDTASGAADDPFATIGAAVRAVRDVAGPVEVNVRPGTYVHESFPIVIDRDHRVIRRTPERLGSRIDVRVIAAPPLSLNEAMFAITADNVAIQGLTLNAGGTVEQHHGNILEGRNFGIYVDTADRFAIDDVSIQGALFGVFVRRSSGDIMRSAFRLNAGTGVFVAAGYAEDDVAVRLVTSQLTENCTGGAFFVATLMADVPAPVGVPLTVEPRDASLDVEVASNRIAHNLAACGAAGMQFFLRASGDLTEPASMTANVHDNLVVDNASHDLAIDSHRPGSEDTAPATFTGAFADNTYSGDPGKRFLGFNFRGCPLTAPVTSSRITVIDGGNELAGFVYDATGTGNTLLVNGEQLTGTNREPCQ